MNWTRLEDIDKKSDENAVIDKILKAGTQLQLTFNWCSTFFIKEESSQIHTAEKDTKCWFVTLQEYRINFSDDILTSN